MNFSSPVAEHHQASVNLIWCLSDMNIDPVTVHQPFFMIIRLPLKHEMKFKSPPDKTLSFCWLFPKLNIFLYLKILIMLMVLKYWTCFGKYYLHLMYYVPMIYLSFTEIWWVGTVIPVCWNMKSNGLRDITHLMLFSSWVGLWMDHLTVLRFSFLVCKVDIIIVPLWKTTSRTTRGQACKVLCTAPGTLWAEVGSPLPIAKAWMLCQRTRNTLGTSTQAFWLFFYQLLCHPCVWPKLKMAVVLTEP